MKLYFKPNSATMILILMASSLYLVLSPPISVADAATSSSDLLQYEWRQSGSTSGRTHFAEGPAPSTANVLWKTKISGLGYVSTGDMFAINGKVFANKPFGMEKQDMKSINFTQN